MKLRTGCTILLGTITAVALFAMMAVTFVDVVGRYVFSAPLRGAYEMTEYLLPLTIFSALPFVTWRREHVTTGLFENALRGRPAQVRDGLVSLCGALACGYLTLALANAWRAAAAIGEASPLLGLPKPPVIAFTAAMSAIATVMLVLLALADLRRPGAGRP